MKTTYAALTVSALAMSFVSGANAGIINYSMQADMTVADVGDTVNITVHAEIDPQGGPFLGLGAGQFDINVSDPVAGGGVINNAPPLLGLHPDFIAAGNQGTLAGSSITDIVAAQFPPMGGPFNSGTELELYTFSYTIMEADAREITLNLTEVSSDVYIEPFSVDGFDSSVSPRVIQAGQIPAPGAMALLAVGGLVGIRRRRA